jgi:hypothetical protein
MTLPADHTPPVGCGNAALLKLFCCCVCRQVIEWGEHWAQPL